MNQLTHYVKGTATIKLLSGMRIGGPKETVKIGGIDNPVIRNPISNMPYIPGSSLKGRFRMALEIKYNDTTEERNGTGPSQNSDHESKVCILFGNGDSKKSNEPTRAIFRDAKLTDGFEEYAAGEEKIEVKMDRKKMAGFQGGNRTQERIAEGAQFDFEVVLRIFEGDDESLLKSRIEEAIRIVEIEFLGGSGSRGYGKVKFENLTWETINI